MGMHHGGTGYYTDGPIHAYRAAWSLIWMYQTIPTLDWRKDPVVPWTPKSFGFSQRQFGLGLEVAYGTDELVAAGRMTVAEQRQLQEALALAFLGIAERYAPTDWVRRVADTDQYRSAETFETMDYAPSYNPLHAYDLPERGYQADAYYLRLKTLKERRLLTIPTMRRLLIWARGVWPKGAWDLLNIAPEFSAQIDSQSAGAGARATFAAVADGFPDPTYQWQKDGVDIAGATSSTFTIASAQAGDAGRYTVVVSNSAGSITSGPATLTVTAAPSAASRPLNLSTRALVRSGGDALIPGFVVSGTGTKRVLIRAIGPTLGRFGVVDALADPNITVKRLNATTGQYEEIAANDTWSTSADSPSIITTSAAVGAFALPQDSADAALLLDLAPGHYTAIATGSSAAPDGVALVELYDADPSSTSARLSNISNRGYVGTGGHIMIPGFSVSHEGPKTLLIRAVGPGLTRFGVGDVLPNPQLKVYRTIPGTSDSELILSNGDWDSRPDSTTAATAAAVGAFSLQPGSLDAALVATLTPGSYTIQASGVDGATGVALVEIYVVP
ncbi:MAG: immunoglobulin domain-containing protein [Opitutaceae bacterium]|nr:immunoglobulin domain-containing protein [Opitutaceae bacterium]